MGKGFLVVQTVTAEGALPVAGASVRIWTNDNKLLFEVTTDANGNTERFELSAPPAEYQLSPQTAPYSFTEYTVEARAQGFIPIYIRGVQIFDGSESVLPINLHPLCEDRTHDCGYELIEVPPPTCAEPTGPQKQDEPPPPYEAVAQGDPYAPSPDYSSPQEWYYDELQTEIDGGAEDGYVETAGSAVEVGTDDPPAPLAQFVQPLNKQPAHPMGRLGVPPGGNFQTGLGPVFLPEFVRVKLGLPTSSAQVVRVPFIDYIKNVTSSEIFDHWPRNSMVANIHVIVTFLLNRIYSEWYPSRGYNFDITSTTQHDQRFIFGRNIFANISRTVDEFFNTFARRIGFANPYFTEYCNGTTATCRGLSQWGTVTLSNRGFTPLQILRYYYHNDMALETTDVFQGVASSYPGLPLTIGSQGPSVLRIQNFLNRIRTNFPAIPQINPADGVFRADTAAAVRAFQQAMNLRPVDGIVGPATWNLITQRYVAVIRLSELNGEAERIGLSPNPPTVIVRQGDRGVHVAHVQYILDVLSRYYSNIPSVIRDSNFGPNTRNAVIAFQRMQGITADGIVGPVTWNRLYAAYRGLSNIPQPPQPPPPGPGTPPPGNTRPYPGSPIREGARGENVRFIQESINLVRQVYTNLPALNEDGIFGPNTRNAVIAFQHQFALVPDGIVGPMTWAKLMEERAEVSGGVPVVPPPPQPPVPPPPPPSGGLSGTVVTTGGSLNVRNAPNTGAPILGALPNGSSVNVLAEQNGWYQINFGGGTGWASGLFVRLNTQGRVSTQGGNLNLRAQPNATAPVLTTIPNGTMLDLIGVAGDFFETSFGGQRGFVSRNFVSV